MSKYLYFQDAHAKGKNSINRIGDYQADWLIKFDELLIIAKKYKVEAILDGGDLLDSPIVSYSVCDAIVDRVEKAKIPFYCLFGNHAERYHSKEHSFDTTLAHILRRSKYFEYLTTLYKQADYVIEGIEYTNNIEEKLKEGMYLPDGGKNWKIAIIHAFICPEPFPYASHVQCGEITTNADLVLCAHYHKPFKVVIGNTTFLNIGCFGRNSITEANIEPACVLLDTEKRSWEIIKLTSAKKGQDVFDLKKVQDLKNKEADIDVFIQSLESVSFQGQSIEHIIKNVAKEDNTKQEVVDVIVNKIQEVQND